MLEFTSSKAQFVIPGPKFMLAHANLQAPVVAIQMWSVPPLLRPLAASLTTCVIHLLGDVPSPPLLGLLQSKVCHRAAFGRSIKGCIYKSTGLLSECTSCSHDRCEK